MIPSSGVERALVGSRAIAEPCAEALLVERLKDGDQCVRAATAEVRFGARLALRGGARSAALLGAHRAIAARDWARVLTLGDSALPALVRAVH